MSLDAILAVVAVRTKCFVIIIESDAHPDIVSNPSISIVPLPPHPAFLQTSNRALFLLFGPLKVLFQIFCLWDCLAYRTTPAKWLLVQVSAFVPSFG